MWMMLPAWAGAQMVCAAPTAWVHEASGLWFPDSIEGKWQRSAQSLSRQTATVEYPQRQSSGAGLTYTDVEHFLGWPLPTRIQTLALSFK